MYLYPLSQLTHTNIQTFHVLVSYNPLCLGRIKVSLLSFLRPYILCKYGRSVRMSPNTGKPIFSQLNRAHSPHLRLRRVLRSAEYPRTTPILPNTSHRESRLDTGRGRESHAESQFFFFSKAPESNFPDCLQVSIGCNDWCRKFYSMPHHV